MQHEFDFLVFIGRFQPYHLGHEAVVREALSRANNVIVLVGSAHRPRCTRNPWTFGEREAMIRDTLDDASNARVHIAPIMDATYNDDLWITNVRKCVAGIMAAHHAKPHRAPSVGLIGHSKDRSSYYLRLFPKWPSVDVANLGEVSATAVRDTIFQASVEREGATAMRDLVPASVASSLEQFITKASFEQLREEHAFVDRYRAAWDEAPYAPTFVTVDAVVVQSGHVLLVERGARPGKGQWALPGGFINAQETLKEAMLRELKEETKIKVPVAVLRGSIAGEGVFDDPHRSARGRTITHAFYVRLPPETALPKVKGSDDAKTAAWVPLADLDPARMFEDHYFIIQRLVGQMT